MVLVLGLFLRLLLRRWLIFVRVLVCLFGIMAMGSVRVRMHVLMLVGVNKVAVAMLVSMFMRVFVDVSHVGFLVFHSDLLF